MTPHTCVVSEDVSRTAAVVAASVGAGTAWVSAAGAAPPDASSAFRLASAANGPAVSITVAVVSTPPPASLFHPDTATGTGMLG